MVPRANDRYAARPSIPASVRDQLAAGASPRFLLSITCIMPSTSAVKRVYLRWTTTPALSVLGRTVNAFVRRQVTSGAPS